VAAALREKIAAEVCRLAAEHGLIPGLAVVLVGDNPVSAAYVRSKSRHASAAGMRSFDRHLSAGLPQRELLGLIDELNADPAVHGILVQLPLPKDIDASQVLNAIDPSKDVDGFHPLNAGELLLARPRLVPATARAVMALLAEYRIELDGSRAVVVGRSAIVGKPVAQLLEQANATVTVCHSHTLDLARQTLDADVLVVATGRAAMISPDMVKTGSTVIDVGINRTEAGLVGDVDPGAVDVASHMTPVPGGVGPMTIACLLRNAVACAHLRRGHD